MSYGFTVYTDRESIATTKVYSETAQTTYSYNYGTGQHSLAGFTDGHYLRFTATPADGYEFTQWVYHIGSPDATTQYSTSNPFTYYGSADNDIYIAAEGVSTGGDDTTTEYFEWSSAVAQGLPIKNVSYTEWNAFIGKIIEVLTDKKIQNQPITELKYGYAIGTTYSTMLNDCYLTYDTELQGYPLTAQKFNIARFIIGSFVSTGIGDKTSETSKVLAADLITLEECLKTWQG